MLSKGVKNKIYRIVTLSLVAYGCETWSLTMREECRLIVLENRVLRRIYGPKRNEVTGEWRKLHNEEVNDLYSSPNIVRLIKLRREMGGACSAYGGEKRRIQGLVGKPEGMRPLRRPKHRWGNNIKMDLHEVVRGGWTGLIWLRIGTGGGQM